MKYYDSLSKDPKMKWLMDNIPEEEVNRINASGQLREDLIGSIVSQQLSIKVAPIIFGRFKSLFNNRFPSNKKIIETDIESLRGCGLSYQKANYIKNIAVYFEENKLKNNHLQHLSDEELIQKLTEIKGVGKWTVEMCLMFSLGREDVFSVADYGISTAMKEIYKIRKEKKELEKKMISIAEGWRPFRTTACLYLWAYKDLKKTK